MSNPRQLLPHLVRLTPNGEQCFEGVFRTVFLDDASCPRGDSFLAAWLVEPRAFATAAEQRAVTQAAQDEIRSVPVAVGSNSLDSRKCWRRNFISLQGHASNSASGASNAASSNRACAPPKRPVEAPKRALENAAAQRTPGLRVILATHSTGDAALIPAPAAISKGLLLNATASAGSSRTSSEPTRATGSGIIVRGATCSCT